MKWRKIIFASIGLAAVVVVFWASVLNAAAPYRMSYADGRAFQQRQVLWFIALVALAVCAVGWFALAKERWEKIVGWISLAAVPTSFVFGGGAGPHSYVSAKNVCINNLRQIDGAKEEMAVAREGSDGMTASEVEVEAAKFIRGGLKLVCPEGGKYRFGKVGEGPWCSVHGVAQ